jgi:hypothetical protein
MSWTKLLASKTVTPLPATKAELDKLRSLVARSLKDVAATGLSTDMRFILAYDAARTLSLMIVRAAGYRPKTVGGHYNTSGAWGRGPGICNVIGLFRWLPHQAQRVGVRFRWRRERHGRRWVVTGNSPALLF